jgi:hypothetical protein
MIPMSKEYGDLVEAYLLNKNLDGALAYSARGRAFVDEETGVLKPMWVTLFRDYAENSYKLYDRQRLDDVSSELLLRDEEPPYAVVKDEIELLTANAARALARMDPQSKEEANEELGTDIESFKNDMEQQRKS